MSEKKLKYSLGDSCPVRNVIARFGNKWALLVLLVVKENRNVRFNVLSKLIPDISTKMLSNTLKVLEADGLLVRTVYPEVPIRVEYTLTPLGESLMPIIDSLTAWALGNMEQIKKNRTKVEI